MGEDQRLGDRNMKVKCFFSEGCGSKEKLKEIEKMEK
jgi:hypothetical protein